MIAILIVLAVIVLFVIGFYNRLKTYQVRIKASIQEIGNQLKRQANLIPNLTESVKGYMSHEKGIFDDLVAARKTIGEAVSSGDAKKLDQSQDLINRALSAMKVIVESNPQIQASTLVMDLMNELRDTSDKVMYSRRTLIDLTADYNTAISTVPGVWLAPLFGFKEEKGLSTPVEGEHLEVSSSETENPKVSF